MLTEEGLKNLFIGYKIEVIELLPVEQLIDENQFAKAFSDRLIQLTLQRE